ILRAESDLAAITPSTALEAMASPASEMWLRAMNREKECHLKNGTFGDEIPETACKELKPIPADWVFKIKYRGPPIDEASIQEKQYKARVVIRGQYMKGGRDFNDTFAPVAKPVTLRALLAVGTK